MLVEGDYGAVVVELGGEFVDLGDDCLVFEMYVVVGFDGYDGLFIIEFGKMFGFDYLYFFDVSVLVWCWIYLGVSRWLMREHNCICCFSIWGMVG